MAQLLKNNLSTPEIVHSAFNWILLLVFLVIVGASYIVFLQPQYQKTRSTDNFSLQESKNYLGQQRSYLNKLRRFNQSIATVSQDQNERLDGVLPAQPKLAELYVLFEDIANRNNLILESISAQPAAPANLQPLAGTTPGTSLVDLNALSNARQTLTNRIVQTSSDESGVNQLDVMASFSGELDYITYKELLGSIENSLRLLDTQTVAFTPGQSEITLNIRAYYTGHE